MKRSASGPSIRFSGFETEWVERKFGDLVAETNRPVTLSDDTAYSLVTVKRRNEGVVPRGKFYGRDILVKNYFEVRAGDFLVSKRQVVHGGNGVVPTTLDGAIVSNEYFVSTDSPRASAQFLALMSCRPEMYHAFRVSSYGVDIEKLVFDVEDWKRRSAFVPNPAEQVKISTFFEGLELLLNLQRSELEKLREFRFAMLSKMFPKPGSQVPEVRLAGFEDDWLETPLGALTTTLTGGGTPAASNPTNWNGEVPWFQSSDLTDDKVAGFVAKRHISDLGLSSSAARLVPGNSLAIVVRVGVGKVGYVAHPYATSQDFLSLSGLKADPVFLAFAVKRMLLTTLGAVQGTAIKGITKDALLANSLNVPTSPLEQQRIGEFFEQLDSLIGLSVKKIEKLDQIKRSLLSKMFI